jgi:hypothetical protein
MDIFDVTIGTFLGNSILLFVLWWVEDHFKKPTPKKRTKEPRING